MYGNVVDEEFELAEGLYESLLETDGREAKRQAEAAVKRNELISKVMESGMAGKLSPELREAAKAQMENPGASLAELGEMMDPPIGKSGMRHRLDKIAEFAKTLQ